MTTATLERLHPGELSAGDRFTWTGLTGVVCQVDPDNEPGFVWVLADITWNLERAGRDNLQWCRIGIAETVRLVP
jgi:hypothetical protein